MKDYTCGQCEYFDGELCRNDNSPYGWESTDADDEACEHFEMDEDDPEYADGGRGWEAMTRAYYNEHDPHAAAWLRNLIAAGLIAPGDVDERSICDVPATDLAGYGQCHFFAGIGGWSLALRLAGVPDDCPVWTGSCPCQPFSSAGKGDGVADARHLWPVFAALIAQCHPERVFGEQVASAIGHGWLDGVQTGMEGHGYACGAAVLGAHSVGAPHIRRRLYWGAARLADAPMQRCGKSYQPIAMETKDAADVLRCGPDHWSSAVWWPCLDGKWRRVPGRVDDSEAPERGRLPEELSGRRAAETGGPGGVAGESPGHGGMAAEPGLFTLASRVSGRVVVARPDGVDGEDETREVNVAGALRGAGNAIVPQVGAAFVTAFEESVQELKTKGDGR